MGYIRTAGRGIGVFGQYAGQAAMFATPPLFRGTNKVISGGIIKPAYKAGRFLYRHPNLTGGLITGAFVGYEFAKGKDAGESIIKGAGEGIGIGLSSYAATAGYKVGTRAGLAIAGRVGLAEAGVAARTLGFAVGGLSWLTWPLIAYAGVKAVTNLSTYKQHFSFDESFGNRRALTMRQSGLMAMAATKRNAMGREAEAMHLR